MVAAVTSQFVRLETLAHQDRRLLRFTGADVGRFLQGVLSADVQQLRPGHAQAAAILTVKGKIISDAVVLCGAEGIALAVPAEIADEVLEDAVPWPVARAEWRSLIRRIALPFAEATLRRDSTPVLLEKKAELALPGVPFTLTGKPDRIDLLPDGTVHVIDYKTGEPPKTADMEQHRKQLHLAAVMALLGAFADLGPRVASKITYQSLKPGLKTQELDLDEAAIRTALSELEQLIAAYQQQGTGFTARRAALTDQHESDFDHLARFGEWTIAMDAEAEDVG